MNNIICSIIFCYWYALWITFHFNVYIKEKWYFWYFLYIMCLSQTARVFIFLSDWQCSNFNFKLLKRCIYWSINYSSISVMDQMFMIHMYLKVFIQFQSLNFYKVFFFFLLVRRQILTVLIIKISFLKFMSRSYFQCNIIKKKPIPRFSSDR